MFWREAKSQCLNMMDDFGQNFPRNSPDSSLIYVNIFLNIYFLKIFQESGAYSLIYVNICESYI
jgi:hypothetical protein